MYLFILMKHNSEIIIDVADNYKSRHIIYFKDLHWFHLLINLLVYPSLLFIYKELKKAVKAHWRAFTRENNEEKKENNESVLVTEQDNKTNKPVANYTNYITVGAWAIRPGTVQAIPRVIMAETLVRKVESFSRENISSATNMDTWLKIVRL